jgi:PAS domain S-box-containing protein
MNGPDGRAKVAFFSLPADRTDVDLGRDRLGLETRNLGFVARVGAALFAAGASLAAAPLILPHASGLDRTGIAAIALAAYVVALILLVFAERFSVTGIQVANALAIGLVTGLIYFSGDQTSSYALLYIWCGLYAFYFLPTRRALVQGGLIAGGYAAVPFGAHQMWWLLVVGTVFVIGCLVIFMQHRLSALICDLQDAARERELLGQIVESSDDAILSKSLDGTVTSWNPGAERLYGIPASVACGTKIADMIVPPHLAGEEQRMADRIRAGENLEHWETERLHKDGHLIEVSITASGITDGDGAVTGISVIAHDITESRKRERALLKNVEAYGWLRRVSAALSEDGFTLYAQPIADVASGSIVREEILLRMHGERGQGDVVEPGAFLPIAEEFDMVCDIDRWVLRTGIPLLADDRELAINLSARSIGEPSITKLIESLLDDHGVDPARLTIEITETALVRNIDAARAFAERLERLGCALALDDFGTGYGSFTYLKHLPVQYLKIDMDFMRDLDRSAADRQVVSSIVGVARGFGIKTIAEGVEDEATYRMLGEFGIDLVQGFFIGRPGPILDAPAVPAAALARA